MKKILLVLVFLSLLINVYYFALWTYSFYSFEQYDERLSHFGRYFPLVPPQENVWFLVLLTFLSILIVGIKDILRPRVRIAFVVVQAIAFALYLWSLL